MQRQVDLGDYSWHFYTYIHTNDMDRISPPVQKSTKKCEKVGKEILH